MKILITGICGFVGSVLAKALVEQPWVSSITGIDNFSRPGSEQNRQKLRELGVEIVAGDIRCASDVNSLPACQWVIDVAANPSVLAGVDGKTSSRQLVEHNLAGTINLLEYCKQHSAGFVLLSTSRVYNILGLSNLKMDVAKLDAGSRFVPSPSQDFSAGITCDGVSEDYSTAPPVSLYGSTKVASEHLALEYGSTFDFPVWINRCGVLAGAGQFGHPAQGIFAFWVHSFREGKPLKYIGFGGSGLQVRDCLHPQDLVPLLEQQVASTDDSPNANPLTTRVFNVSGGIENSMSLAQLTAWCSSRYPDSTTIASLPSNDSPLDARNLDEPSRPFDIPWMVLDSGKCQNALAWQPAIRIESVLEEIADFADGHPSWLKVSAS